jgi:hypothetical protein
LFFCYILGDFFTNSSGHPGSQETTGVRLTTLIITTEIVNLQQYVWPNNAHKTWILILTFTTTYICTYVHAYCFKGCSCWGANLGSFDFHLFSHQPLSHSGSPYVHTLKLTRITPFRYVCMYVCMYNNIMYEGTQNATLLISFVVQQEM